LTERAKRERDEAQKGTLPSKREMGGEKESAERRKKKGSILQQGKRQKTSTR